MNQSGQVRLLSAGTKDNLIVKPVDEQSKSLEIHVYGHLLSNSFLKIAIESSGKERSVVADQVFVDDKLWGFWFGGAVAGKGAAGAGWTRTRFSYDFLLGVRRFQSRHGWLGLAKAHDWGLVAGR
jgi:hypothetical protein